MTVEHHDRYQRLVALGGAQLGFVTAAQGRAAGWSLPQLRRAVEGGYLRRAGPCVYALPGAALPGQDLNGEDRRTLASDAILACLCAGTGSVASHRTAAALHRLDGVSGPRRPDVTVAGRRSPRYRDATVHRPMDLAPGDTTTVADVPCTKVPRTLIDLGAVCPDDVVERAVECALRRREVSIGYLWRRLERAARRGRPGVGAMRRVLVQRAELPATDSDLESVCVQLIRDELGIEPDRHVQVLPGVIVDVKIPGRPVVVEVDGYEFHSGRRQLLHDLERQNRLVTAGFVVVRFGYEHVYLRRHRELVAQTIAAAADLEKRSRRR